jgi:hypothetical protein
MLTEALRGQYELVDHAETGRLATSRGASESDI